MAFDGFLISRLIKEIHEPVVGSRIDKIVYFDDVFCLGLYNRGQKNNLLFDLNGNSCSLFLDDNFVNQSSNHFANIMKKQLNGGIIQNIYQHETDRVIILDILVSDFFDGQIKKQLIFEAMGRHGNLIITNNNIIIDSYKRSFNVNDRSIVPNATFQYLPTTKLPFHNINYQTIISASDLVNTYQGISPLLAKHLIKNQVQLDSIQNNPSINNNSFYIFNLFDSDVIYHQTISQMLAARPLISNKISDFNRQLSFVDKLISRTNKKLIELTNVCENAEDNLVVKEYGDEIYASSLDLNQKLVAYKHIPLDYNLTLNQNAQKFYQKYQKAKRTINHSHKLVSDNNILAAHLHELKTFLSFATIDSISEIEQELLTLGYLSKLTNKPKTKKITSPKLLTINLGNDLIIIGKNSIQNEYLVKNISHKTDYWLHVKDAPGSHVLLRTNSLGEKSLRSAAMLCAYFSSLKNSSSIPVDYTLIKDTKKIPGRPGYNLSFSNHKTIYIDIDEKLITLLLESTL